MDASLPVALSVLTGVETEIFTIMCVSKTFTKRPPAEYQEYNRNVRRNDDSDAKPLDLVTASS